MVSGVLSRYCSAALCLMVAVLTGCASSPTAQPSPVPTTSSRSTPAQPPVTHLPGRSTDAGAASSATTAPATALPSATTPSTTSTAVPPTSLAAPAAGSEASATGQSVALADAAAQGTGWSQTGIASWYGPGFQGRRTANGERFNTNELTAAHKTLPFGTRVRVKSAVNGKEVVVRINDRGPFITGRIIDLSRAAAQAIGMAGIKRVTIETLR